MSGVRDSCKSCIHSIIVGERVKAHSSELLAFISMASSVAKQYDLTKKMAPFFDIHMILNILDFLKEQKLYDAKEIAKEKIKAIESTNRLSLIDDECSKFPNDAEMKSVYDASMSRMGQKKTEISAQLDNEPEGVIKVKMLFEDEHLLKELKNSANLSLDYLSNNMSIDAGTLESYYQYSKFKYECGVYDEAASMLNNFLSIHQAQSSSYIGALWGRLACRILKGSWENGTADFVAVKDAIESRGITPMDQLFQRAWLLHWSLFVFIGQRDGFDQHGDFCAEKNYLQTLENLCPWMLRYYALSCIIGSKKKNTMRDLLLEIQHLKHVYSDPITQFIEALYQEFDFELAQIKLKESQEIIKNDFFMQIHADRFMQEARMIICDVYCTINRRVDLSTLSQKLEMTEDEAEKFMVDMVQKSSSPSLNNAKIDSSSKQVIMASPNKGGQQDVVDRTRDLTVRSGMLSSNIDNLLKEQGFYLQHRATNPFA